MPLTGRTLRLIQATIFPEDNGSKDEPKAFEPGHYREAWWFVFFGTLRTRSTTPSNKPSKRPFLRKKRYSTPSKRDAPPLSVELRVLYPDERSRFVVRTELGDIDVIRIDFFGEISLTTEFIPVTHDDYIRSVSGKSIAQSACFRTSRLSELGCRSNFLSGATRAKQKS